MSQPNGTSGENPLCNHLVDLNDDCLIAICRKLSLVDLNSFATTCNRLKSIARDVFVITSHFPLVNINELYGVCTDDSQKTIAEFFENFGNLIKVLTLEYSTKHIYELVLKHCSNGALEALHLYEKDNLNLDHLKYKFPKLKTYKYKHYYKRCPDSIANDVENFLAHHTNLIALQLHVPATMNLSIIFRLIQLEILHLYAETRFLRLESLETLTKLKELFLYCQLNAVQFFTALPSTSTLQCLHIVEYSFTNDLVVELSRFYNIMTFKCVTIHNLSNEHIEKITWKKLTEFILEGKNQITQQGLLNIVNKFRKLRTITLADAQIKINHDLYVNLVDICHQQNRKITIYTTDRYLDDEINLERAYVEVVILSNYSFYW